MANQLTKIKSQISDLKNAFSRLKEALALRKTMINRDATIQRFEFTFELAWKLMQSANRYFGQECHSPRECIRIAAQNELIADPKPWFEYLEERNTASHVYDEAEADEVYEAAKKFKDDVSDLIKNVSEKIK